MENREEQLAIALARADCHPIPLIWARSPDGFKNRWRRTAKTALDFLQPDLAVQDTVRKLTFEARVSDPIIDISTEDLIVRLRDHVLTRGAPTLSNGAWALMLEASRHLAVAVDKGFSR